MVAQGDFGHKYAAFYTSRCWMERETGIHDGFATVPALLRNGYSRAIPQKEEVNGRGAVEPALGGEINTSVEESWSLEEDIPSKSRESLLRERICTSRAWLCRSAFDTASMIISAEVSEEFTSSDQGSSAEGGDNGNPAPLTEKRDVGPQH